MRPPPPRSTLFPYTTLFRSTGNTYMAWYGYDGMSWTEHRRHDEGAPQAPEVAWTVDLGATVALGLSLEASPEHSRSEEHTSELQSQSNLVCRLLLEKKKNIE